MRNKGFTLIELLGVLTLLAIIALIVVPIISASINKASIQSQKRGIEFYADAVEQAALSYRITNGTKIYGVFSSSEDGKILTNEDDEVLTVEYNKGIIKCDTVVIDENNNVYVIGCLNSGSNDKYSYSSASGLGVVDAEFATCIIESGDEDTFGSEISCGISSDATTITMLAKKFIEPTDIAPKQTDNPPGNKFSDTNYWSSSVNSYPADVYNENSDLYKYLDGYRHYLFSIGVSSARVTLPNIEVIETLGCSEISGSTASCSDIVSWAKVSNTYWTQVATASNFLCVISSSGLACGVPSSTSVFYIKPIVIIDKLQIK